MPSELFGYTPEPYDPSTINMFLGDDPRTTYGPEDLYNTGPKHIPETFDPSTINMFLGDDPLPYPSPSNPYADSGRIGNIGTYGPEDLYFRKNAFETYRERQPLPITVVGGGGTYVGGPHAVENAKITAMAHALAGVPQVYGARLSDEAQAKVSAAMEQALSMIQAKMDAGENYESALNTLHTELGAPPVMLARSAASGGSDSDGGGTGDKGGWYLPDKYKDQGYCPVSY